MQEGTLGGVLKREESDEVAGILDRRQTKIRLTSFGPPEIKF